MSAAANKRVLKRYLSVVERAAADLTAVRGCDVYAVTLANLGDGLDLLATAVRDALEDGDPEILGRMTDAMMGVLADEPPGDGLTVGEFLQAVTRAGMCPN